MINKFIYILILVSTSACGGSSGKSQEFGTSPDPLSNIAPKIQATPTTTLQPTPRPYTDHYANNFCNVLMGTLTCFGDVNFTVSGATHWIIGSEIICYTQSPYASAPSLENDNILYDFAVGNFDMQNREIQNKTYCVNRQGKFLLDSSSFYQTKNPYYCPIVNIYRKDNKICAVTEEIEVSIHGGYSNEACSGNPSYPQDTPQCGTNITLDGNLE